MNKKRAEVEKRLLYIGIIFVAILLLLSFVSDFILGKTAVFLTLKEAVKELIFDTWKSLVGERFLLAPSCSSGYADNVSQYNITWFFDGCYRVGQFVNGDWWVVGPVNITRIAPTYEYEKVSTSTNCNSNPVNISTTCREYMYRPFCDAGICKYQIDNPVQEIKSGIASCSVSNLVNCVEYDRYYHVASCVSGKCNYEKAIHGSMLNPEIGNDQGYVIGPYASYNKSFSFMTPISVRPGSSLVSSRGRVMSDNAKNVIGSICNQWTYVSVIVVLTIVDNAVPNGMFRPPYIGNEKPLFNSANINYNLLFSLPASSTRVMFTNSIPGVDRIEQYAKFFEKPWILHKIDDGGSYIRPCSNQPAYYSLNYPVESEAALLLLSNFSNKKNLTINFIQYGIDSYYASRIPLKADRSLSKWPAVFAGIILGNETLQNVTNPRIKTEMTYYGNGWTGATALWRDYPLDSHNYEHVSPYPLSNNSWCQPVSSGLPSRAKAEAYRRSTHSWTWVGIALAVRLMNAERYWNHDAFFDYIDRWMTENDSSYFSEINAWWATQPCGPGGGSLLLYQQGWTPGGNTGFVKGMWNQYRNISISAENCVNGQSRNCALQQGVCAGSQEICSEGIWPGCLVASYGIDYEIIEANCNDGKDNDCNGLTDSNDDNCVVIDTVPPVISSILNNSITNQSAIVSWQTDEGAISRIYYGLTTNLGSEVLDLDYLVAHSLQLVNLLSNTTYYYKVGSCDVSGNCANSSLFNFRTAAGAFVDIEGPIINLGNPSDGSDLDSNSLIFSYIPNDFSPISSCTLYLGVETRVDNAIENSIENSFSVNLANGDYSWNVSCIDSSGNRGESEIRTLKVDYQAPVDISGGGGYSSGGGGGYIAPQPKVDSIKNETLVSDKGIDKISLEEGEVGFIDIGLLDSIVLDLYSILYEVRFEVIEAGVLLKVPNGDYLIPKDDILPVLLGGQEMYVAVKRADANGAGIILGLNRELVREQLGESAVEQRTGTAYIIIGIIILIIGFVVVGYIFYRRDKIKKIEPAKWVV